MAQPKRKMSKARHNQRHSAWKLESPTIISCPQCHEVKLPHRVCPSCGYYGGKEIVKVEAKKA